MTYAANLPSFQTFVESTRCANEALRLPDALPRPDAPMNVPMDYGDSSGDDMDYEELQQMPSDLRSIMTSLPSPAHDPVENMSTPAVEEPARVSRTKKKYLTELQRYEIVCRVLNGERQAHLAREYGVTRAAVCYLLKHQVDVVERVMPMQRTGP